MAEINDRGDHRLGYVPSLDGIRAFAVVAVMLYHAGFVRFRGGYLGVSSFFTLSGFLITTLLLTERADRGSVRLTRFWERRVRRLLPAAAVTLVAIALINMFSTALQSPGGRIDILAALGYVSNWRFAFAHASYGAAFANPSPVMHFWSLSIEEQFYLFFPLLFVLASTRHLQRFGGWLFAALGAVSASWAWVIARTHGNAGLAYYGTHTRAVELLAGVVFAYVYVSPTGRRFLERVAPVIKVGAFAAAAGLAVLWTSLSLDSRWVFRGGILANVALTLVLIAACLTPGPARRLLGLSPLAALGRISYGVYLYHWPIFLLLGPKRINIGTLQLTALRFAVTLAVSVVSYVVIERPVRFHLAMPRPRFATSAVAVLVAAALVIGLVPLHRSSVAKAGGVDYTAMLEVLKKWPQQGHDEVKATAGSPSTRVLLVGDSYIWSSMPGFLAWNKAHPSQQVNVDLQSVFGCPLGGGLEKYWLPNTGEIAPEPNCANLFTGLPAAVAGHPPDRIVVAQALGDLAGRRIDGKWRRFGDPVYDAWFTERVAKHADVLASFGVPVYWARYPPVRVLDPMRPSMGWKSFATNQPEYLERLNSIVANVVAGHRDFHMFDAYQLTMDLPGGPFNPKLRDGVHWQGESSYRMIKWMLPAVLAGKPVPPAP